MKQFRFSEIPNKKHDFAFLYSPASLQGSQMVLTKKVMVTAGKLKWPHMCRSWGDAAHWQEWKVSTIEEMANNPQPAWSQAKLGSQPLSLGRAKRNFTEGVTENPLVLMTLNWSTAKDWLLSWMGEGRHHALSKTFNCYKDTTNRGGTEMLKNITIKILEHRSGQRLKFRENLTPP